MVWWLEAEIRLLGMCGKCMIVGLVEEHHAPHTQTPSRQTTTMDMNVPGWWARTGKVIVVVYL
ncbi:MAG: hypothetical protein PHW34_15285 [Hespellia sp.]|nr:hypothetical protein [Hespellia sp.]